MTNAISSSDARSVRTRGEASNVLRWFVAGILLLTVLAGFFDRISVAVLFSLKSFQDAMGTGFNPTLLGLLMTGFLVAYGISGVALGWLVDFYGPRRMLGIGLVCWGGFMALMGTAGGFVSMLIYRVLLGLAEGPQFGINNKVPALVQEVRACNSQCRLDDWQPARIRHRLSAHAMAGDELWLARLILRAGGIQYSHYSSACISFCSRFSAGARRQS